MSARAVKAQATAVVAVALALVLVGAVLLAAMLRERATAQPTQLELGGLTLKVQAARWVEHDHESQGGFRMPSAMMPGAPEAGERRLRLEVVLENPGTSPRRFDPQELRLQGPDGTTWPLEGESLGVERLGPGLAVAGGVYFDLPAKQAEQGDPGLSLVWESGGEAVRARVPVGTPAHGDGH